MQIDFLEEVLICLEVACQSMEDILDMGVLTKLIVSGRADEVCTRHVQSMY